jgi:hypothetical protein
VTAPDPRHPRCGGEWRGPFDTDHGPVEICNTCGEERTMTTYADLGGHTLARLARRGDAAAKAEQTWRKWYALGVREPRPATSSTSPE